MTTIRSGWAVGLLVGLCLASTAGAEEKPAADTPAADKPAAESAAATREVTARDLKLQVPMSWKEQQPSNELRLAQFAIPPVEGDKEETEFVVFPPFGGSEKDNIERWIAQFESEEREVAMTKGTTPQGEYIFVDLAGTYKKPDGPPFLRKTVPAPGYRMLAVILMAKSNGDAKGNYFLKVTGPKKTVASIEDAFRKSFAADAGKEAPYTFAE